MAYTPFDETSPDPTTQNGGQAMDSIRYNQTALRDMVLFGAPQGWSIAWNPDNTVDSVTFNYYAAETGGTAELIGTVTFTYNADKAITASTWS